VTIVWSVTPIPWIELYGLPLALGVLALLGAVLVLIIVIRRALVQRPWGVLMIVRAPPGTLKRDYPLLNSDGRGRIFVGRKRRCQIRLNHSSIELLHAVIFAKKRKVTEQTEGKKRPTTVKKPVCLIRNLGKGIVEVGGVRLREGQVSRPLQDKTPVIFGDFEFQWRKL